jgi:pantetheine-phosphate adenylyltransferase
VVLAVCPGSYDPFTLGHLDVVRRARGLADEVVVLVAHNAAKSPLLDVATRVALIEDAVADLPGVRVASSGGLLADELRTLGADVVVKGLRGGADFDAELPMALMNRHLSGVETAFVVGDPALSHVASSLVKDVARHGGRIEDLVTPAVAAAVRAALGAPSDPRHAPAAPAPAPAPAEGSPA